MGIGDWGLGIWVLGFGAKTQTPKTKPQKIFIIFFFKKKKNNFI